MITIDSFENRLRHHNQTKAGPEPLPYHQLNSSAQDQPLGLGSGLHIYPVVCRLQWQVETLGWQPRHLVKTYRSATFLPTTSLQPFRCKNFPLRRAFCGVVDYVARLGGPV